MTEQAQPSPLEQEKWEFEKLMRQQQSEFEREKIDISKRELLLKEKTELSSKWRSPLIIALLAAALAATGNAVVSIINGHQNRLTERTKSENHRILEMIKTGDIEQASKNLQFLVETNLIANPEVVAGLKEYLENRLEGTGPVLASTTPRITPNFPNIIEYLASEDANLVNYVRPATDFEKQNANANTDTIVVEHHGSRRYVEGTVDRFLSLAPEQIEFITATAPNGIKIIVNRAQISGIEDKTSESPELHPEVKSEISFENGASLRVREKPSDLYSTSESQEKIK